MTFGEKLQALRKQRGWTQEELAGKIAVSRQALSKWELGAAVPDTGNVLQISELFGVSTDYLLHDAYQSDADLSAIQKLNRKISDASQARLRRIVSGCLFGASVLGILLLGILSSVFPAVFAEAPVNAEWVRVYEGLWGFLKFHNLEWLFALLVLTALAAGGAGLFYPKLSEAWRRIKERRRKNRQIIPDKED